MNKAYLNFLLSLMFVGWLGRGYMRCEAILQPCGQCWLKVGYLSNIVFFPPTHPDPPCGVKGGVLEWISYNPGVRFYDKCLRPYVVCCGVTNLGFVPQLFTQRYLVSLLSLLVLGMRSIPDYQRCSVLMLTGCFLF